MNLFLLMLLAAAASPNKHKHRSKVKQIGPVNNDARTAFTHKKPVENSASLNKEVSTCVPCPNAIPSIEMLEEVINALMDQGVSGRHVLEKVVHTVDEYKQSVPLRGRSNLTPLLKELKERLEAIAEHREYTEAKGLSKPNENQLENTDMTDEVKGTEHSGVDRLHNPPGPNIMENTHLSGNGEEDAMSYDLNNTSMDMQAKVQMAELDTAIDTHLTDIDTNKDTRHKMDPFDSSMEPTLEELESDIASKIKQLNENLENDHSQERLHLPRININKQSLPLDLRPHSQQSNSPNGMPSLADLDYALTDDRPVGLPDRPTSTQVNSEGFKQSSALDFDMLEQPLLSPRDSFNIRSHGPFSAESQPYFNPKKLPSVTVAVMHPYVDRTYSVDVGLMPFMGVNDAFQQAYLKYSFRFPGKENPFDVQLVHLKSKGCYFVKAVTALNSVTDVEWLIQVYNAQGEPKYQDVCIPSNTEVVLQSGDVIKLRPLQNDVAMALL